MSKTVKDYRVTVEAETIEPWAVPALFNLIREQGRYYGLSDIEHISFEIRVELSGTSDTHADPEGLSTMLDRLWAGRVSGVEVRDVEVRDG